MRSEEWWKGRTKFRSAPKYEKGYYSADSYFLTCKLYRLPQG